ncbi:hypothetical protein JKP88DRAFT_231144 [Tribonema minus]|uniref:Uncharacterized protein n=1 Tax=Tribonema minus TaxID=303371 RepID=A0A836CM52_9STRA|nr:hypothetical protein JKP88DRAFT_231144 [Tribonema minus]
MYAKSKRGKKTKTASSDNDESSTRSIGEVVRSAWNGLLVALTVASVVLAVDAVVKLKTQPITLDTLGNLLPLAAFGVAGAARLVAVLLRLVRVLVTVPVVLGGAYLAAPSIPDLLKHSPDLATGGLFAVLATPEVLEAIALIAVIVGAGIWIVRQLAGMVTGMASVRGNDGDDSDDEYD